MSSAGGDGGGGATANIELGTTLLLTTTSKNSKYTKIWRRTSLNISFLISLKKSTTTANEYYPPPSPLSSVPYASLSPSEPPARTSSSKSCVEIDIEPPLSQIVKEKDLKSLLELGGVKGVCDILHGQRQHSEESSIGVLGTPIQVRGTSFSNFLFNSCKHNCYTIPMLLIAAGFTLATGFKQEGPRYGWHDGVAIVFAAILVVAFSSIANFWRQREMMKLAKRRSKLEFTVQRGEEGTTKVDIPISDIRVGDKVCLRKDDEVPAHGLLVDGGDILVLEEATQSKRDCERNPFLVAGSKVIEGHGLMLVVSLGSLDDMQSSMSYDNPEKRGLLESLIEKPISYIGKASLFIFTMLALVVYIRLVCKKDGDTNGLPEMRGKVSIGMVMEVLEKIFLRPQGRISIFTCLFTVVVLCVQHGVPLMVTMSLNYQIEKLESDQGDAVLHDLSACTTMGLVTVICIDVSGGIISKPMEVSKIWMGKGETDIRNFEGSEIDLVVLEALKRGVCLSVLAPELSLSPLSHSLVSWAETTWEMNMKSFTEQFDILKHRKLSSDKEGSGVLVRKAGANEQPLHLYWSGAASTILEMCSQYYDTEGECCSMENQKIKFGQVIQEMKDSGLKPIAFAHRQTQVEELEQDELILIGLIGLKYTCQESTKLALRNLRNTGIKIKLVSGDDIMLVKDIACDLGVEVLEGGHVEGKQLQDLHGKARLEKVDQAIVMGSFSSEDKLLMVQSLQEKGHVVAFMGRKSSHASVLKVADVGIVHDPLSKKVIHTESSGISIKCFCALKPIVRAGRSKYVNIQKFIQLQLTFDISGLFISIMTTVSTGNSPLTAIQLFWVSVLMCFLGCIMMGMELSSEEQLANPPSNRNEPIITIQVWKNIVIQVFYQAFACMVLEFGGHVSDWEKRVRTTMIFNTFLLCQLFNQLNTMGLLRRAILKIVVLQRYCLFLVGFGGCFLVQVLVIEYAKGLANGMGLNATQWAICIMVGALSWVLQWALRSLPDILRNYCASAPNTPESITQPHWFYIFPFVMLLLFHVVAG